MTNPYAEFDDYGLRHLPAHLIELKQWESLEEFLTDLYFIEAKCAAGMTYDLTADYTATLEVLPEAQEENRIKREREARVQKYIQDLIAYSKGEIQTLGIIPSVEPWSEEKIKADIERIKNNPTRLDRIKVFAQFVSAESHALMKFASLPGFVIQHAYNSANSGPVANTADALINGTQDILFLQPSRPHYNPHPTILRTLEGEFDKVCVTLDCKRAVSAYQDYTLRIWDLDSGVCVSTLAGHTDRITALSVTPDGKRAMSGSIDETLRVWDLEHGVCLLTLPGHARVRNVHITPDGRQAVSESIEKKPAYLNESMLQAFQNMNVKPVEEYQTLWRWDLNRGICLKSIVIARCDQLDMYKTLAQYGADAAMAFSSAESWISPVMQMSMTPDGIHAVAINGWGTVFQLWDLRRGVCLYNLRPPKTSTMVSVVPDGRRAISWWRKIYSDSDSDHDDNLLVWDLECGVCLHTLVGHTGEVHHVCITLDGRCAVSCSADHTLRVWDLECGTCLYTLTGHTSPVQSVSITPDGVRAISQSRDRTLRVWDLKRGLCLRTIKEYAYDVNHVSVTPDGIRAISQSRGNILQVWDLEHGVHLQRSPESPDKFIYCKSVTKDGKYAILNCTDHSLQLWDLEHGAYRQTLTGHPSEVTSVNITANAQRAVSGGGHGDQTLRVWDLESGSCLYILEGHTAGITCVKLTPDGRRAISGSYDKTLRMWDINEGTCLHTLIGHLDRLTCVNITPDGRRAVSGSGSQDRTLRIWDLESGSCLFSLEGHTADITCVSFTPDGRWMISGGGGYKYLQPEDFTLHVWDLEHGICRHILKGHTDEILRVSVSPDGKYAVSSSRDQTRVWDLEQGICLYTFEGRTDRIAGANMTPDGKHLFTISDEQILRVWDLTHGTCIAGYQARGNLSISTIAAKRYLICAIISGELGFFRLANFPMEPPIVTPVRLWLYGKPGEQGHWDDRITAVCPWCGQRFQVAATISAGVSACLLCHNPLQFLSGMVDQQQSDHSPKIQNFENKGIIRVFKGHQETVKNVAFICNGRRAASAGWSFKKFPHVTIQLWDVEYNVCLQSFGSNDVELIKTIPTNGRIVVLNDISGKVDRTLQVWDMENNILLHTFTRYFADIQRIIITPDGKRMVSGHRDGALRIWDLERGICLQTLAGQKTGITSLTLTTNGRRGVSSTYSGSKGTTLRVWDLEHGICLMTLEGHGGKVIKVTFTPDGCWAVSGGGNQYLHKDYTLRVWDLEQGKCLNIFEGHIHEITDLHITPDGKFVVSSSTNGSLQVWDLKSGTHLRTLGGNVTRVQFTPDGMYAVTINKDRTLQIWDLHSGDCLIMYHTKHVITAISEIQANGQVVCGTDQGELILLNLCDFLKRPPLVTSIRLWLYGESRLKRILDKFDIKTDTEARYGFWTTLQKIFKRKTSRKGSKPNKLIEKFVQTPGKWDENITVLCQWCGQRFPVTANIRDVISGITRTANLTPDQSPCFELPDEAWDEPKLLSECPLCHQPLKFNPFIVDNRGRW